MCILQQLPFYNVDIHSEISTSSVLAELYTDPDQSIRDNRYNFPNSSGVKLGHLNIRSINNKKGEVYAFLKEFPYDILSLSETWLDEDTQSTAFNIENYSFERKP